MRQHKQVESCMLYFYAHYQWQQQNKWRKGKKDEPWREKCRSFAVLNIKLLIWISEPAKENGRENGSTQRWQAPMMMMMMMFETIMLYNENDKWWKRAKHTECGLEYHYRCEKCAMLCVCLRILNQSQPVLKTQLCCLFFHCVWVSEQENQERKSKEIRDAYKQAL